MGKFDITAKVLIHGHPRDWLALAGLPCDGAIEPVDADLSALSLVPDKLLRVNRGAGDSILAHLEFQAGCDREMDRRMLTYNVLARWQYSLPVESAAVLLRKEADSPAIIGRVFDQQSKQQVLDFTYPVVRVWRLPVETLLSGGIGTLPLAPISDVDQADLPDVVEQIRRRIDTEIDPATAGEWWLATEILLGLRYDVPVIKALLSGVRYMRESTTYQAILEEGEARGEVRGKAAGLLDGERRILLRVATAKFGPPSKAVLARLESISDPAELERLSLNVFAAAGWDQLMAS